LDVDITMSVANGKMMAYVAAHGDVLSKQYDDNQVTIHCRMPQKYLGRITDPEVQVKERTAASSSTGENSVPANVANPDDDSDVGQVEDVA
jgi:GTP-binding protein HflX